MLLEIFSITLFIPLISLTLDSEISKNNYYLFFKNNLNLDLIPSDRELARMNAIAIQHCLAKYGARPLWT